MEETKQSPDQSPKKQLPESILSPKTTSVGKDVQTQDFGDIIAVRVCNPQIIQGNLSQLILYTISGWDKQGSFEVKRRYNEFVKIRTILVARWPGCHIPSLPPKKIIHMEKEFIKERMMHLEHFCQRIAESPNLHYSDEYQVFLRANQNNLEQELQKFEHITQEEILQRYNTVFVSLLKEECNNETVAKISEFKAVLESVIEHFGKLKEIFKHYSQARKTFYEKMGLFHKTVCVPYEELIFNAYHDHSETGKVFSDSQNERFSESANTILKSSERETTEYLQRWIEFESAEIEAFLEAFSQREKYEVLKNKIQERQKSESANLQQILAGNNGLTTKLFGKSREKTLESINQTTHEVDTLCEIQNLITLILSCVEIEYWKVNKLEKYYRTIKFVAQMELENLENMHEFWNEISQNNNIQEEPHSNKQEN